MMLTDQDKEWLRQKYPDLRVNHKEVSGVINFRATYNKESGQFYILENNIIDTFGDLDLAGSFNINIKERTDRSIFKLPAVNIKTVDNIAERHLDKVDKSACLCSPLEEDYYLLPSFNFQKFIKRLVIPFLYGQLYYDYQDNHRWPWPELTHGSTGLLESYYKKGDSSKIACFLKLLKLDSRTWPLIESTLKQKKNIGGHTLCFCGKEKKIKYCHPDALSGVRKLKEDIKNQK